MEVGVRDASLAQADYPDVPTGLKDLGVNVIEVNFSPNGLVSSPLSPRSVMLDEAGCSTYRGELNQAGVRVCAFLCAQKFGEDPVDDHVRWVVSAVRAAERLGVPAVRIDSAMGGNMEWPREQRISRFVSATLTALNAIGDTPVRLGIENHGAEGNDPEWMDTVLDHIDDPRVGLTLDLGNWYWYGHPLAKLYDLYARYAPKTVHTHVKNIRYPAELREQQREVGYKYGEYSAPLDEGDIDFARAVRILRDGGYDGDLVIEDESLGKFPVAERQGILRRDVEHLRKAIGDA